MAAARFGVGRGCGWGRCIRHVFRPSSLFVNVSLTAHRRAATSSSCASRRRLLRPAIVEVPPRHADQLGRGGDVQRRPRALLRRQRERPGEPCRHHAPQQQLRGHRARMHGVHRHLLGRQPSAPARPRTARSPASTGSRPASRRSSAPSCRSSNAIVPAVVSRRRDDDDPGRRRAPQQILEAPNEHERRQVVDRERQLESVHRLAPPGTEHPGVADEDVEAIGPALDLVDQRTDGRQAGQVGQHQLEVGPRNPRPKLLERRSRRGRDSDTPSAPGRPGPPGRPSSPCRSRRWRPVTRHVCPSHHAAQPTTPPARSGHPQTRDGRARRPILGVRIRVRRRRVSA